MASSNTPRHSKKPSSGVTIDLEPQDVMPVADEMAQKDLEAEDIQAEPVLIETVETVEEPVREEVKSAAPVAETQSRGGSSLLGGLVGGILALVGGAGLQWAGVLPSFQNNADVATLRQEIAALSEKANGPAIDPDIINGLSTAQVGFQKNAEALAAELSIIWDSQKKLVADMAALKSSSGVAGGDPAAVTVLMDKLGALETEIGALKSSDASAQLTEMQTKLAELQKNAGSSTGASNVAQAIAAAGLKAAIDRGGAFANELETFATVAPASPELEQLKNLAASGVPSKADLTTEFGAAADSMIAATQVVDPNAGLMERLTNSAKSLVRSRPVGVIEGDTPEAVVARMEVAVNKGDLDAALTEAGKLPDAARAAGIDYINKLTARRDTDALVSKALTSALTAAGAAK